MNAATIARYQVGGDIYNTLLSTYGANAASSVANAALTGDRAQLASALALVNGDGPVLNDSTGSILANQLETSFTAAPFAMANTAIGNAIAELFKNPWIIAAIGGGLFLFLGGGKVIRRHIGNL